jgi:hypothetical protein
MPLNSRPATYIGGRAAVIALSLPACADRQDADVVMTGVTLIDGTGAPPRTGTTHPPVGLPGWEESK